MELGKMNLSHFCIRTQFSICVQPTSQNSLSGQTQSPLFNFSFNTTLLKTTTWAKSTYHLKNARLAIIPSNCTFPGQHDLRHASTREFVVNGLQEAQLPAIHHRATREAQLLPSCLEQWRPIPRGKAWRKGTNAALNSWKVQLLGQCFISLLGRWQRSSCQCCKFYTMWRANC